jgi:hypothetical protein
MEHSSKEGLLESANSSNEKDTTVNSAKRRFPSEDYAREFYRSVHSNLFRISEWRKNSTATTYDLFDESGLPSPSDEISTGKFIRIELHGSGKYDWVRVQRVTDEHDEVVLTVKPSHDPTDPDRSNSISHFFGPEAENNFCVQLNEKSVAFYVIGLNEKQNTKFTGGFVESARNAAVANVGYYSGLQKAVWKDFATNFLMTDEEKEK